MSMKALETLREMLCVELEEIAHKPELGAGDLEIVHKLTDTLKNIDKIEMLDEGYSEDGYSRRGDSYRSSNRGGNSGRGGSSRNSYARRGEHYVRGHYSRSGDAMEEMERMMEEASSEKEREAIRRCMELMD